MSRPYAEKTSGGVFSEYAGVYLISFSVFLMVAAKKAALMMGAGEVNLPTFANYLSGTTSILFLLASAINFKNKKTKEGLSLFLLSALFFLVTIEAIYSPLYAIKSISLFTIKSVGLKSPALWLIAGSLISALAVFAVALLKNEKETSASSTHGSAEWANFKDIKNSSLLTGQGVYLSGYRTKKAVKFLQSNGPESVLVAAPSRSGKGVGIVIPTLLSWQESVFVNDIKGENYALTAGFREKELKNTVHRFDPTSEDPDVSSYNPLAELRDWPNDVRDAQNIADILIDPEGKGDRDHWDQTAHEILTAAILHQHYIGENKTLSGCLDLLSNPVQSIDTTLEELLHADHGSKKNISWTDNFGEKTNTHPVISGSARSLLNKAENERSSVVSTAVRSLGLYRDPIVKKNTSSSDFSLKDLMHSDTPHSIYVTIPPSDLSRTRPLVRLLINQLGQKLTTKLTYESGSPSAHYKNKLLLMLDEFPTLGRLEFLQSSLAYLPGYGIKAVLITQDFSQLYSTYGKDESIVSNCHTRVAFAPNKIETAKLLSEMVGTTTTKKEIKTYTGSRFAPMLTRVMAAQQETQRPLMTPDEIMRLSPNESLVFISGQKPILGEKIKYFESKEFLRRAKTKRLTKQTKKETKQMTTKIQKDTTNETNTTITLDPEPARSEQELAALEKEILKSPLLDESLKPITKTKFDEMIADSI